MSALINQKPIIGIISLAIALFGLFGVLLIMSRPEPTASRLSHYMYQTEEAALLTKLTEGGSEKAFQYIRSKLGNDPSVARDCHGLMHALGRKATEYYGSFNEALSKQDEICNSGYIHGVIEGQFVTIADTKQAVLTICSTSVPRSFEAWQCYHGIGHGVMYKTDKNLPSALQLCDVLPEQSNRTACVNGAFMEHFIVKSHGTGPVADSIPTLDLCKRQIQANKAICYTYASTAYLEINGNDYDGAVKDCQASEPAYVTTCVAGVGSQAMKDNISKPAVSAKFCARQPAQFKSSCVAGAISQFIYHHGNTNKAIVLCKQDFVAFRASCEAITTGMQKQYNI